MSLDMNDVDWEETNNALRHHGLNPIRVSVSDHKNFRDAISTSAFETCDDEPNDDGNVIVEKRFLASIQETLHRLMSDCDRRQGLITDLIKTNNTLRDSAKASRRGSSHSQRGDNHNQNNSGRCDDPRVGSDIRTGPMRDNDIRTGPVRDNDIRAGPVRDNDIRTGPVRDNDIRVGPVRDSDIRVGPVRDNDIRESDDGGGGNPPRVWGAKQRNGQAHAEELQEVKHRLAELEKEESRRRRRQEAVFNQFKKRSARANNLADNTLLDVIDMYEREIERMDARKKQEEVSSSESSVASANAGAPPTGAPPTAVTPTDAPRIPGRTLMKNYEKQLRDAEAAMKNWKTEMKKLQEEIETRPSLDDLLAAHSRIKQLERKLATKSGRRGRGGGDRHESEDVNQSHSGAEEAVLCLNKLREKLDVQSCIEVLAKVEALFHAQQDGFKSEKMLRKLHDTLMKSDDASSQKSSSKHKTWCSSSNQKLLETIKRWSHEMSQMKLIYKTLGQLHEKLLGENQQPEKESPAVTSKAILASIDHLLKDSSLPSFHTMKSVSDANPQTMSIIIRHFQTLFDVPEVCNVITRMNDVYNKLNEIGNILKNLRGMLGLEEKSPGGWAVVDAVAQLSNAVNASSTRQLQEALGVKDLETVVQQVGEHQEFCPVFTSILQKVMEVLVVDNLEKVLPAIHALKLLATPAPAHEVVDE